MTIKECIIISFAETGYSIKQVAANGGLSRQTVSSALKGKGENSRMDTKVRLAKGFNKRLLPLNDGGFKFIPIENSKIKEPEIEYPNETKYEPINQISQGFLDFRNSDEWFDMKVTFVEEQMMINTVRLRITDRKPIKEDYITILKIYRSFDDYEKLRMKEHEIRLKLIRASDLIKK